MRRGLVLAALSLAAGARADESLHYVGDLGIGVERTQACAPGASARTWALPYAYGDYGRLSPEGTDSDGPGLAHRTNPRPVGLGTFQETPWGGVFVDAFVDSVSGGSLLEASYADQFPVGPLTLYPQAGVTRRSARYDAHLYDVHAASTTPVLQLSGELPFADAWVLLAHMQWEPLDDAVRASARVDARSRTSALVALAWRFK